MRSNRMSKNETTSSIKDILASRQLPARAKMTRKNFMLLLLVTLLACLINQVHARGVAVIGSHGTQLSIKSSLRKKGKKTYEILDAYNLVFCQ